MIYLTSPSENGKCYDIMNFSSKNLCYLLWKAGVQKEKWAITVASWVKCNEKRAWELLADASGISDRELRLICQVHGLAEEDFSYSYYLELDHSVNILHENIKWMLNSLARGGKKEIATKLNKDQVTLSRWLRGDQVPTAPTLEKLRNVFGIPPSIDLASNPLFLSPQPLLESEQKNWIHSRIDEISYKELQGLFPALQKLLSNSFEK